MAQHDIEMLNSKLSDKLVISVKQAYDVVRDITDFHLLNTYNLKEYDYTTDKTIVVWSVSKSYAYNQLQRIQEKPLDIYFYYLRFLDIQTIDGDIYLVGVATDYAGEYPDAPYIWKQNKLNQIEVIGTSNIEKYSINFELSN